jgi:hypothetical protein
LCNNFNEKIKTMARKLASIQKITKLLPIQGADRIELAEVLGWNVVVEKGIYAVGSLVVYCEIDSILPENPEFEFLRERKFRIKTIKLRGQISQGICFPTSILPANIEIIEDLDVTKILGIKKWEPYQDEQRCQKQTGKIMYPKWMPQWIQRIIHNFKFAREYYRQNSGQKSFPSLIPKTDETRVQVLQPLLDKYTGTQCYVTEKIDGSSITIYQINGKFGVCSRNIDLKRDETDKFWKTVLEHDLENKFKKVFGDENIALQGELIGEGIQGNKYHLKGLDIYFFNVFFIKKYAYGNMNELIEICQKLNEKTVPILDDNFELINSIPELVELSKGESKLFSIIREGIVIRPIEEIEDRELDCQLVKNRVSFKSVNPEFLLKYEE